MNERTVARLMWSGLTSLGYFLGLYVGVLLGHVFPALAVASIGAGTALLQRPVLRRLISGWDERLSAGWVLASTLGLTASFLIVGSAASVLGVEYAFGLSWPGGVFWWGMALTIGGFLIGCLQWLVLRRRLRRSSWWILASTAGWAASTAGFALAAVTSGHALLVFVILAPTAAGLALGYATAGPLVWIARARTGRQALGV